ncbi:MAG: ATP synthase subunit I [Acidimicrobiales bacterium]
MLSEARSHPVAGPAPELQVARDLARRAIPVAPVLLVAAAIGWGWGGVASSAIGIGLVVVNFLAAALIITTTIRISLNALMAGVLFGFLLRLTMLTVAVVLLRKLSFIDDIPLLFTVLITHIGLLMWETRYVSMSLAYPGLKPRVTARAPQAETPTSSVPSTPSRQSIPSMKTKEAGAA